MLLSDSNVPLYSAPQGSCSIPVGENLDLYAGPQAALTVDWQAVKMTPRSSSLPVMMSTGDQKKNRGLRTVEVKKESAKLLPESLPL